MSVTDRAANRERGRKPEPRTRRFSQVDVFSARPFLGNPVAVVLEGDGGRLPAGPAQADPADARAVPADDHSAAQGMLIVVASRNRPLRRTCRGTPARDGMSCAHACPRVRTIP